MRIIAQCPKCGNTYLLNSDFAGRRNRCANCRTLFKIPGPDQAPRAYKIIENVNGTIYVDQNGRTYG